MKSRLIAMFLSLCLISNSVQCSYLSFLNKSLSESSKVIIAGGIAYGFADLFVRVFKIENCYSRLKAIGLRHAYIQSLKSCGRRQEETDELIDSDLLKFDHDNRIENVIQYSIIKPLAMTLLALGINKYILH